jgi:hypothetical protein
MYAVEEVSVRMSCGDAVKTTLKGNRPLGDEGLSFGKTYWT